jgi:hypothetical protein
VPTVEDLFGRATTCRAITARMSSFVSNFSSDLNLQIATSEPCSQLPKPEGRTGTRKTSLRSLSEVEPSGQVPVIE